MTGEFDKPGCLAGLRGGGSIDLLGSPLKLSRTSGSCRRPPPRLGEHSTEVLVEPTQRPSDPV